MRQPRSHQHHSPRPGPPRVRRTGPRTHTDAPAWSCFFFSSRRRHTRCLSDWSSDVCSSDLNYTVVNGRVVDAPSFFGSNPAEVREGPRAGLRVLAAEEDLGRDLIAALTAEQRKTAIVEAKAPADILTSNGRQAALKGQASGISAAQMTPAQLAKLTALLDEYA